MTISLARKRRSARVEIEYFDWICAQIDVSPAKNNCAKFVWELHIQKFEFSKRVPRDEDRYLDGLSLRWEFLQKDGDTPKVNPLTGDASLLECLVALARRLEYIGAERFENFSVSAYFWLMVGNMGLKAIEDDYAYFHEAMSRNEDLIDKFFNREYDELGRGGGLFPLKWSNQDQRKVDIWYQAMAYLA
jgi:hypothetical protein